MTRYLSRIWERIAAKTKWPRRCWHTPPVGVLVDKAIAEEKANKLQEDHKYNSETIRRSTLVLVGFTLFCWAIAFGRPDVLLLAEETHVELPFGQVAISFLDFLVAGPSLLIILILYLHIFVANGRRLEVVRWYEDGAEGTVKQRTVGKVPTLFNIDSPVARLLTAFILYWLVPLTFAGITYKALARPEWGIPLGIITVLVTFALVFLQIRRCPDGERRWWNMLRWVLLALLCVMVALAMLNLESVRRPFNLYRANLKDAWLPQVNLRKANLAFANMEGANLTAANLNGADLYLANLQRAELVEANMQGVRLSGANLQRATLYRVNLQRAKLDGANLQEAALGLGDLQRANLAGANLQGASLANVNLQRADLNHAKLQRVDLVNADLLGANLRGAELQNADLIIANLYEADLAEANLEGASLVATNLRGAKNLTQQQLDTACGNNQTTLPSGLSIKMCPRQ